MKELTPPQKRLWALLFGYASAFHQTETLRSLVCAHLGIELEQTAGVHWHEGPVTVCDGQVHCNCGERHGTFPSAWSLQPVRSLGVYILYDPDELWIFCADEVIFLPP